MALPPCPCPRPCLRGPWAPAKARGIAHLPPCRPAPLPCPFPPFLGRPCQLLTPDAPSHGCLPGPRPAPSRRRPALRAAWVGPPDPRGGESSHRGPLAGGATRTGGLGEIRKEPDAVPPYGTASKPAGAGAQGLAPPNPHPVLGAQDPQPAVPTALPASGPATPPSRGRHISLCSPGTTPGAA